ncbi:radical SAM/SPASM domain-containing protein [candidate division CSSED10-310 bacterium]|uniref:Radical SAM/SPASM domain-containing protein n=1 Tax=candidate division CSSED10-310 bacterium TaxID=2855610 RepID=A0ABV6YSZ7_UNCC1
MKPNEFMNKNNKPTEATVSRRANLTEVAQIVIVELTTKCNFYCKMCIIHDIKKPKDINEKVIYNLLENTNSLKSILFVGMGEPTLCNNIMPYIKEIHKKGIPLIIVTNGSTLKPDLIDLIVKTNTNVVISFDAATKETFEKIKINADFSSIMKSIQNINLKKAEIPSSTSKISLRFVAMKSNIEELPSLVHLANSLNIDSIDVSQINIHYNCREETLEREQFDYYFEIAKETAEKLSIQLTLDEESTKLNCSQPFVTIDGKIKVSCNYHCIVGDLNKQSFENLWNSQKYKDIRDKLTKGEFPLYVRFNNLINTIKYVYPAAIKVIIRKLSFN